MAETYIPWAIRRPGPWSKTGYTGVSTRTLAQIEGEVKHSMEGGLATGFGELDKLTRQASWHFSGAKDGRLFQHYPLEAICWHAGLPGDRRMDTSLIGNLVLIGYEHEGVAGEPLTAAQLATTIRLSQEIRRLCPSVGAAPPTLRRSLWEHGWVSPTACPSGRIPWPTIIAALMPQPTPVPIPAPIPQPIPVEEEDMIYPFKRDNHSAVYRLDHGTIVHITRAEWDINGYDNPKNAAVVKTLPATHSVWQAPVLFPKGLPDELN